MAKSDISQSEADKGSGKCTKCSCKRYFNTNDQDKICENKNDLNSLCGHKKSEHQ